MELPLTGGCQCGGVRYRLTRAPRLVYACHCTNCQHLTGSAFSMGLVVPEEAFHLDRGEPRPFLYRRDLDSATPFTRWLCSECGSWLFGGPKPGSAPPGALRTVRAGTLSDTSWLRPAVHFWARSAQPWVVLPHGRHVFDTQPDDLKDWFQRNA
jgi:hypothetical protein